MVSQDLVKGDPAHGDLLTQARAAIDRALREGDVPWLLELHSRADVAGIYHKRNDAKEAANDAGEIKVRAERALGQLDAKAAPHGGRVPDNRNLPPLKDLHQDTRAAWRKLGKLSEKRFDQFLAWARNDEESGVSTSRLIEYIRTGSQGASTTFECYTPTIYIEASRQVLGTIDLDPASSPKANETVGASRIFTEDDDGLAQHWAGRVFLNPPYGRSLTSLFVTKLVDEHQAGSVTAAILLINAYGFDAAWFQPLWNHRLCFTDHRIPFYGGGPTFGSLFVYLGPDEQLFAQTFSQFGAVLARAA